MKKKLTAFLLVITLTATAVFPALNTVFAASSENLFENGKFTAVTNNVPNGWVASGENVYAHEVGKYQTPDGDNAITFTSKGLNDGEAVFYSDKTIKIEKNHSYTVSFWAKVKDVRGLKFYLYEPDYAFTLDGKVQKDALPVEGQNIYTYSHNSGTTHVCRTEIDHVFKVNDTVLTKGASSMAIVRDSSNRWNVLTTDWPEQNKPDEWVRVTQTFTTGDKDSHIANVRYGIRMYAADNSHKVNNVGDPVFTNGEVSFGGFTFAATKIETVPYSPTTSDPSLGGFEPAVVNAKDGEPVEFTALATNNNKFVGWYNDGTLVTTEEKLSFVWDESAPTPKYEARFEATGKSLIADPSFEKYNAGQMISDKTTDYDPLWSLSSQYALNWQQITVTDAKKHWGDKSIQINARYSSAGYLMNGLTKNTRYVLTYYTFLEDSSWATQETFILPGNTEPWTEDKKPNTASSLAEVPRTVSTGEWVKNTVVFNSGDNTSVMWWTSYDPKNAVDSYLYVDDFSLEVQAVGYSPAVNDATMGVLEPSEVSLKDGQEAKFNATPNAGIVFDGWYVDGVCVSDKNELSFTYEQGMEIPAYEARFRKPAATAYYNPLEDIPAGTSIITAGDSTKDIPITFHYPDRYLYNSPHPLSWQNAFVASTPVHSGKLSISSDHKYSFFGNRIDGLKKNTNYVLTFYTYQPTAVSGLTVGNIYVTSGKEELYPANPDAKDPTELKKINEKALLATGNAKASTSGVWQRQDLVFNSGDNTNVTMWFGYQPSERIIFDDIAVYEYGNVDVSCSLGGEVSTNVTGYTVLGSKVQVTAAPYFGNTFAGWYDGNGVLLSKNLEYSFVLTKDCEIDARFEGHNMPAREVLAMQGMDGTLENGVVNGFYFDDSQYGTDWCSAAVSKAYALNGQNSIRVFARHRNTHLQFDHLRAQANYCLTYYIRMDDEDLAAALPAQSIIDVGAMTPGESATIYGSSSSVAVGGGWHKVTFYFNTGAAKAVQLYTRFVSETSDAAIYLDDISLYEYQSFETLNNSDFEQTLSNEAGEAFASSWIGAAQSGSDGSKVGQLASNSTIYQVLATQANRTYTVSFKAKGKVAAGASEIMHSGISLKNAVAANAYVETDSADWKTYSYSFTTTNQRAMKLLFMGLENDAMIDDVTVTDAASIGNRIELIDFETNRNQLSAEDTAAGFSIYEAASAGDKNVHSGTHSLYYPAALSSADKATRSPFLGFYAAAGTTYKVEFWYKITGGRGSGSVLISPDYLGVAGASTGYEQLAQNSDWNRVVFCFTIKQNGPLKFKIGGLLESDVYIDDIDITVAPPMVMEEHKPDSYCEEIYNILENPSFERKTTDADWGATLPNKFKVVNSDKALKGSHYLQTTAGAEHVYRIKVTSGKSYVFGASVRGTAGTKGNITVCLMSDGKLDSFRDIQGAPASTVIASTNNQWVRDGFEFVPDASGYIYLRIQCTAGTMDIDSIMLFESDYSLRYDANDYKVYVDYNYDDLKSSTTLYNGGYGQQRYFVSTADEESLERIIWASTGSPATGDHSAIPVVGILSGTLLLAAVVLLITRRKEGAAND